MNKKAILVSLSLVVLAVFFFVAAKVYDGRELERAGKVAGQHADILVRDYSPRLGPEEPAVYLVEFLDPECESCRAFYPYVKQLLADYRNEVALGVRYAPFHQNSRFAIKILEAARKQGKYWETLEILFAYQPEWGSHHAPQPELIWSYLPKVGLDVDKIKVDMEDPEIEKMIDQDSNDGDALGVKATPTFFINGEPLREFGFEPLREQVQQAVGMALERSSTDAG